jgi:menaquinone-dependent protoporphyrinogen oxidase
MIAEAFVAHGLDTDIGAANAVDEIEVYDAIVVGGALYNDRWHQDATDFVDRNLPELRERRVWFFSSGPLDESARSGSLAPVRQVGELARRADIRGHMTFGGYLAGKGGRRLSSLLSWGKPGDFRDPQQVTEWVEHIVGRLDEPRSTIVLPDAEDSDAGLTSRMIRRLVTAGDDLADDDTDLGLDVLMD